MVEHHSTQKYPSVRLHGQDFKCTFFVTFRYIIYFYDIYLYPMVLRRTRFCVYYSIRLIICSICNFVDCFIRQSIHSKSLLCIGILIIRAKLHKKLLETLKIKIYKRYAVTLNLPIGALFFLINFPLILIYYGHMDLVVAQL